jgi:DNA polymerase III delta subunit
LCSELGAPPATRYAALQLFEQQVLCAEPSSLSCEAAEGHVLLVAATAVCAVQIDSQQSSVVRLVHRSARKLFGAAFQAFSQEQLEAAVRDMQAQALNSSSASTQQQPSVYDHLVRLYSQMQASVYAA